MKANSCHNKVDVIVVGGSYLGLLSGITLAALGLKVVVLEKHDFDPLSRPSRPSRLFAISNGSCKIIKQQIGLDMVPLGQNINHIKVMEFGTDASLDFNPRDLSLDNFGVMVEESEFYEKLIDIARRTKGLTLIEKCVISDARSTEDMAEISTKGPTYEASIVLVCDGKNSLLRDLLGIEGITKNYRQSGIICDIWHEADHQGVAVEKFTLQGPFAILPKKGGHESSIVWTLNEELADSVQNLKANEQIELIRERFGMDLGSIKLMSQLKRFPLELRYATTYAEGRFYLLGDALHALHPLAGQGLNLSLRDFEFVVNSIAEAKSLGLDVGANALMADYFKSRYLDNQIMIESTDFINALFSNSFSLLKCSRSLGLDLVDQMPALKSIFMRYAAGV